MKMAHPDDVDKRLRVRGRDLAINPYPESALAAEVGAKVVVKKTGKPITVDCYAAHLLHWRGGATPKRRPRGMIVRLLDRCLLWLELRHADRFAKEAARQCTAKRCTIKDYHIYCHYQTAIAAERHAEHKRKSG